MPRRSTALLATAGIAGALMVLPMLFRRRRRLREDREQYALSKQPAWAPPGWAFPVAWTMATVSLAAATQHLAFRQNHPRRTELLTYLGLHTVVYATFSRVYFDERSPVLAAVWTLGDFVVCHLAFYRALGVNGRVAAGFVPVNLWLTLATPLSLYQAAANPDPFFGDLGVEIAEALAAAVGATPVARQS